MANYKVTNFIELDGKLLTKQGTATNPRFKPLSISVTGTEHKKKGFISGAGAAVIYDSNAVGGDDLPETFDHGSLVSDIDCQIQLIDETNTVNCILEVTATNPFNFEGTFKPAADTTVITAVESLGNVTKIAIAVAADANYELVLID